MQMISSRTIALLDDQTLAPGEAREALFRHERYGFILYLSDSLALPENSEKLIRLDTREALIWLSQTSQDEELFCG